MPRARLVGAEGHSLGPQGTPVEWTEEQTYFFRLSEYQDKLLKLLRGEARLHPAGERRNEIVSFVRAACRICRYRARRFDWGIPVPGDPGHIIYVWVDALTNYITGLGFPDVPSQC